MIRHIVMWKLPSTPEKQAHARTIQEALESLIGQIPQIRHLEVGINTDGTPDQNWDVVLVSDFDTLADLDAYQVHPAHQAVIPVIKSLVESRACVDYVF